MPKINDLKGMKFGHLEVLNLVKGKREHGSIVWACRCACGTNLEVSAKLLVGKGKKTCGCGLATDGRLGRSKDRQSQTPEYRAWINMKKISDVNPERPRPPHWSDFHAFMKDMGKRGEHQLFATHDTSKPYSVTNNYWRTPNALRLAEERKQKEKADAQERKHKEAVAEFTRTFSGSKDLFKIPDSTSGS